MLYGMSMLSQSHEQHITYCLVVFGGNADSIVLHLDGIQAIVFEAHL